MLSVKNLKKDYNGFIALKGISFDIKENETLGILGPNGAGKSTTMKILTGFLPPSEGKVEIFGHDVLEDSDFSEHELVKELGNETIEIIKVVSEDKSLEWEERKEAYIHSIRISSENVKAVSISDKIHNAKSLLNAYSLQGKKTWDNFNRGRDKTLWFQNEMLKVFKETWKHPLVDEYEKLVGQMNNLD